ncbi:TolC family protein [Calderihabitans maritimus]|uniref:Outer membrane efflux protein n=1 Tax=Calderihabitans maritimus TaxID=1246530 RepID=A0A1Z5HSY1_9FIRM|nr:TolC family protein [Calderihabitans maritimus]GAW92431.1 outer membrane efflux protein [Calderihabitans maritimus]
MFKRTVILVAVLVLLTVAGAGSSMGEGGEYLELSLAESIRMALENNGQVKLAQLAVEDAERALEEAEDQAEEVEDKEDVLVGLGMMTSLEAAKAQHVAPRAAEAQLKIARAALDYTKRSISLAVEKSYYDLIKAEKTVSVSQAAYERAVVQLNTAQASLRAGMVAKNDVLMAEVQLAKAKADLATAENNYRLALMQFNRTLGIDLNTPVRLTDTAEYEMVEEIDLAEVIEEALQTDLAMVQAREGEAVAALNFEYTSKYYTPNVFAYRQDKYALEQAKVKLEETRQDTMLAVYQAYNNLKTAEANYHVLTKSVEQAKESLRLSQLRYEVGVATSLEVLQASEALQRAELMALEALHAYNLARAQFKYRVFGLSANGSYGAGGATLPAALAGMNQNGLSGQGVGTYGNQ